LRRRKTKNKKQKQNKNAYLWTFEQIGIAGFQAGKLFDRIALQNLVAHASEVLQNLHVDSGKKKKKQR